MKCGNEHGWCAAGKKDKQGSNVTTQAKAVQNKEDEEEKTKGGIRSRVTSSEISGMKVKVVGCKITTSTRNAPGRCFFLDNLLGITSQH